MIESVRSEDAAAADPSSTASARVTAARHATAVAFVGSGVVFASWVSRIPQVRSELQLTAADLGIVLLALAVGSLLALPAAAVLIRRFGTRVVVSAMTLVTAGALTMIGVGYHAGTAPVVLGLFLMGFGLAASNVGMNVQAAAVERRAGRAIMSRFHAGYSIGTVGSALLGAGLIAIGVPVTAHLTIVAVLAAVAVPVAARAFLPDRTDPAAEPAGQPAGSDRPRRRLDRRTLLIGVVVLAFAFAEGAGNDWIAVALVDDHHTSAAVASLGYAAFLTTMTLGRWTGPKTARSLRPGGHHPRSGRARPRSACCCSSSARGRAWPSPVSCSGDWARAWDIPWDSAPPRTTLASPPTGSAWSPASASSRSWPARR